ncbi:hypothetical protein ABZ851_30175 [Streptomyces sp. NPDC047049]|uniref:hypothetical protein n=1 Tax=Streptomyces sp. NPDC047049 TaxID=3156688 RepID=UPI0033C85934
MCFICRVLLALALSRIVIRLVLYGAGVTLLAALTEVVRAALLRDGSVMLGAVGMILVATWGTAFVRRRARQAA